MPARARGVAPAPRGRLVGAPRPSPPYPARAAYILLLLRCCVPVRRSPSGPGLPAQRHRSTPLTRTSSGTNSPRGGTRSSTLRELYGIVAFIAAVAPLLCGRRNRVLLDNLGCVFILGSVVPDHRGPCMGRVRHWRLPRPQLFEAQLVGGCSLQAVWQPREINIRGWTSAEGRTLSTASAASRRANLSHRPLRAGSASSITTQPRCGPMPSRSPGTARTTGCSCRSPSLPRRSPTSALRGRLER